MNCGDGITEKTGTWKTSMATGFIWIPMGQNGWDLRKRSFEGKQNEAPAFHITCKTLVLLIVTYSFQTAATLFNHMDYVISVIRQRNIWKPPFCNIP